MRTIILIFALFVSYKSFANKLSEIDVIASSQSCFSKPFQSWDSWIEMLSKRSGFSLDRFPFTKEEFENYQNNLECYKFIYEVSGVKVSGFITYPKGLNDEPLPTVIYNRGGNGRFGSINFGLLMNDLMPLASQNFVVIASNYRHTRKKIPLNKFVANGNTDEFGGVDVQDVLALVKIIEQLDVADENRIGVFGISRGGMQSYLFAKEYPDIKAMVIKSGISDVFSFQERDAKVRAMLKARIPDYSSNEAEALKARSAIFWPEKLPKIPILLIHAKDDVQVSFDNSEQMVTLFKQHDIPYEFLSFDKGGHDLSEYKSEVNKKVFDWFRKHL